ncbi:hypothetical protein [Paenibacillus rhizophilus]|uniref:Uncharacterized protein n=1 Tax=Paenibacillus rhizophilus TaxID=1850366 RepID=A0A3N9P6S8_9BACL|nr:hypothetical protein [Paenibacillus rhizophilus]RQW11933.1 hypothetical protein EH198_09705 [Paenibacillus rhizophilus]
MVRDTYVFGRFKGSLIVSFKKAKEQLPRIAPAMILFMAVAVWQKACHWLNVERTVPSVFLSYDIFDRSGSCGFLFEFGGMIDAGTECERGKQGMERERPVSEFVV